MLGFTSQLGSDNDCMRSRSSTNSPAGWLCSCEVNGATRSFLMVSSVQVLQGLRETLSLHSLYHGGSGWQHQCSLSSDAATGSIYCPQGRVYRMKMSTFLIRIADSLISCQKDRTTLSTLAAAHPPGQYQLDLRPAPSLRNTIGQLITFQKGGVGIFFNMGQLQSIFMSVIQLRNAVS